MRTSLLFLCIQANANDVDKVYRFDIPSQSLVGSLGILSQTTERLFLFPYDLVETKESKHLYGFYTAQQALDVLLAGTGLQGELSNNETFMVKLLTVPEKNDKSGKKGDKELKTQKTVLASIFAMLFTSTQGAQENNETEEIEEIEVIEVTGVRRAIINARNEKLHSNGIIDAYFAEDMGKSSDENITSALARLPGVTIERGGEGGDQGTVVVRGIQPALNLIKFNGVTLTSNTDNQGVDLSNYSADILSSILVSKSASAKEEEGSLGGTIYLNSVAPLSNNKDVFIVGLEARYNDLTEKITPRTTFSFLKNFDEKFGFSGSLFFDDSEARTDSYETFFGANAMARNKPLDQNGNELPDGIKAFSDAYQNYRTYAKDTRKQGGTATIQWRPDFETDIRFDIAYSKQNEDFTMYEKRSNQSVWGQSAQGENWVTIDTNTNRVIEYWGSKPGILQTREKQGDNESLVLGLDFEKSIGDNWFIHSKLAYSKTSQYTKFETWNLTTKGRADEDATAGVGNGLCGFKKEHGDGNLFLPTFYDCPWYDSNNPVDTLGIQAGSAQERELEDKYHGFYFDVSRTFDDGFIISIDAGIKYTKRSKDRFEDENYYGAKTLRDLGYIDADKMVAGVSGWVLLLTNLDALERTPDGVLDGIAAHAVDSYYSPNISAVNQLIFGSDSFPEELQTRNPAAQWNVEEKTQAAYIQANYELLDGDIVGNFGVRYVKTAVVASTAIGFTFNENYEIPGTDPVEYYPAEFSYPSFTENNEYSELLSSANIKYSLTDEIILRASAARVMARPGLNDLVPGYAIKARDPGSQPTSNSGGNTDLDPFLSDQFDLSAEWYFNDTGLLSATLFHKKMDSFTYKTTEYRNMENPVTGEHCMVDRTNAGEEERWSASVAEYGCQDVKFVTVVNGAKAKILGLELGYTQNFDFLPGAFSHTGVSINYTYADSEADTTENPEDVQNGLPFLNTSENSVNSVLYWDNDGYSFRLAHTWRDKALMEPNSNGHVIIRDARGTLDFSANWKATDDLSVSFSGRNLTNSYDYLYQAYMVGDDPDLPVQISGTDIGSAAKDAARRVNHMGRSYRLGLRYTF